MFPKWNLSYIKFCMTNPDIKSFISQSTYSTVYMPIYKSKTKKIFAYEALSKFVIQDREISCIEFFSRLHSNDKLFFLLEKKNKQHQIKNAKTSNRLVLHFDIVVFKRKEYRKYWKELLSEHRDWIIISITSQTLLNEEDILTKQKMLKWLIKNEFDFMVNIFNDFSYTCSFEEIKKASYLRIHNQVLKESKKDESYKNLLSSIIEFAKKNKTKTLMKHIDTTEELAISNEFELDYIHGEIFNSK